MQGATHSPRHFAVFLNDLKIMVIASGKGCHLKLTGINVIVYADGILIVRYFIFGIHFMFAKTNCKI